jgi:hypothetical protein
MDEQTWLTARDPQAMLDFLRESGRTNERGLLLFAMAVCRRVEYLLTRGYVRSCPKAIEVWERHADGLAGEEELQAARDSAHSAAMGAFHSIAHPAEVDYYAVAFAADAVAHASDAPAAARDAARAVGFDALAQCADRIVSVIASTWEGDVWWESKWLVRPQWEVDEAAITNNPTFLAGCSRERATQAALLRDLFGNPFHPLAINSAWLTPKVVGLAFTIYQERAFEYLPVLADLLEAAGCGDAEVLAHLRGLGPHVRGCHVVDALMGRD